MAQVLIEDLRKYMLARIDSTNEIEVDKVNRYVDLIKILRGLKEHIESDGVVVETVNGQQIFQKENPALNAYNKAETTAARLLNSIEFKNTTGQHEGVDLNVVSAEQALL